MNLFEYLEEALPDDHSRQSNSGNILKGYAKNGFSPKKLLHFGCGNGDLFKFFQSEFPKIECIGIDIDFLGLEIHTETKTKIHSYNFVTLPTKNDYFELVYCQQALEHLQKPQETLLEIARVLKAGGLLIGQTSQFEPHHSLNLWNFTPYGFKKMVEKAGMKLIELRPGIDGLTLMERSYTRDFKKYRKYFGIESPLNEDIEQTSKQRLLSNKMINYKKLMYSGHFCFVCVLI